MPFHATALPPRMHPLAWRQRLPAPRFTAAECAGGYAGVLVRPHAKAMRPNPVLILAAMLDHFRDIDALQLDEVEPMAQPFPLVNVLRDDVVGPTLDRDEVLAMAPKAESGRFMVPPILGEAP